MSGFVIEYNRKSGDWRVDQYESPKEALAERLRREKTRTDTDIEIASLNSDSLETIKQTHSRYFRGRELAAV